MSGKRFIMATVVVVGLGIGASSNAQAGTRRPAGVTVEGDRITLQDLSPTAPVELLGLDVAPAPSPGGKTVISRSAIRAALERAGADPRLADGLPARQLVHRAAMKLSVKDLEPLVADALGEYLPVGVGVSTIRGLAAATLPEGTLAVEVRPGKLRQSTTLSVMLHVDDKLVARQSAVAMLSGEARTPTLRSDLPRGSVVKPSDIEYETTPIDRLPSRVVTHSDGLVGKRLTQPGRKGKPVQTSAVQTPPAIARGAIVKLVAKSNGLTISRMVVAQEDGKIGESIRVTPQDTRDAMEAIVHSATEVRIAL
jgi:flagella basal body P-ring formation protein FlgA